MSLRARLAWLALLCVACAGYGSFVPLRWRPVGWVEGLRRAAAMPLEPVWHVFNGDFFTNVLVFLPIGFFAAGALSERQGRRRYGPVHPAGLAAAALLGSLLLSALLELGQVYIRDRTPSWSDVYAQTMGGTAGAVLWTLVGAATVHWVAGAFGASTRQERFFRLLGIYVCGLDHLRPAPHGVSTSGASATAPLDIASRSVSPGPCWATVDCGVVCGPSRGVRGAFERAPGALVGCGLDGWRGSWTAGDSRSCPAGGRHARRWPIRRRGVGLFGGWLAVAFGWRRMSRCPPRAALRLVLAGLAGLLAVIALCYWTPFDFGVSAQALEHRMTVLYTRAPFHRYYWLPPLVALGEILTLALLSMTTSLLIFLASSARGRAASPRTTVLVTDGRLRDRRMGAVVPAGATCRSDRRADRRRRGIGRSRSRSCARQRHPSAGHRHVTHRVVLLLLAVLFVAFAVYRQFRASSLSCGKSV